MPHRGRHVRGGEGLDDEEARLPSIYLFICCVFAVCLGGPREIICGHAYRAPPLPHKSKPHEKEAYRPLLPNRRVARVARRDEGAPQPPAHPPSAPAPAAATITATAVGSLSPRRAFLPFPPLRPRFGLFFFLVQQRGG